MISKEITPENVLDYAEWIPDMYTVEIKREYFRGLAGEDEKTHKLTAAVFWELKNMEDESFQTEAEILWFFAKNAADGAALLKEIELMPELEEIRRFFVPPVNLKFRH